METIDFNKVITDNIGVVEELILPHGQYPDGVFIMFHRKSDDFPLMVKPYKWDSYKDTERAEGVVLVQGGKMLVVALQDAPQKLAWSSAAVSGGGTTTTDRVTAFNDWDGKNNTAKQVQHPECSGENYAPGYCNKYSVANANGKGLTAGKWWLPSEGELMFMYANMIALNEALSIAGGSPIVADWYWTSTEGSSSHAWYLIFSDGYTDYWLGKVSSKGSVRPVSAFIS